MSLSSLITAAERAQSQLDPVRGSAEDNCAVLKELALEMVRHLSGLVSEAGGDNDYIQPYFDSLQDDIDHCFRQTIERASEPDYVDVFRPRAGLLKLIAEGGRLMATE